MADFASLAFVDLETTGFSPKDDRITEIGVVTVDAGEAIEWTTLVNPGRAISHRVQTYNGIDESLLARAPRFKEIAGELVKKLSGRLFIAHNARFDYSFLRAAFDRVGIEFHSQVLCSLMLSRKLYIGLTRHDLGSIMERHGLQAELRHRALPDARLVWQFWRAIHRDHRPESIANAISTLLTGPVFPAHLDPCLIERLPDAPGVYVLHGAENVLHVGHANNLRIHLRNYFRIDRSSAKAIAISQLVRNITWRIAAGPLGARLQSSVLSKTLLCAKQRQVDKGMYSWRLNPKEYPSLELISGAQCSESGCESYGLYESEGKARTALRRLAHDKQLCYSLLGIAQTKDQRCMACVLDREHGSCGRRIERLKHLTRVLAALASKRVERWPFAGPIGIRERAHVHIVDNWCYLGTARNEAEVDDLLQTRASDLDQDVFRLLARKLPRLAAKRIIRLQTRPSAIVRLTPSASTALQDNCDDGT